MSQRAYPPAQLRSAGGYLCGRWFESSRTYQVKSAIIMGLLVLSVVCVVSGIVFLVIGYRYEWREAIGASTLVLLAGITLFLLAAPNIL